MNIQELSDHVDHLCSAIENIRSHTTGDTYSDELFQSVANLQLFIRQQIEESPIATLIACGQNPQLVETLGSCSSNPHLEIQARGIVTSIARTSQLGEAYYSLVLANDPSSAAQLLEIALSDPLALATNSGLYELITPVCNSTFEFGYNHAIVNTCQRDMIDLLETYAASEELALALGCNLKIGTIYRAYTVLSALQIDSEISGRIDSALEMIAGHMVDRTLDHFLR